MSYKGELYSGEIVNYYDGTSQEEWVRNFKDGVIDGNLKQWYEDGQLQGEGNMKNGKENGKFKLYMKMVS